MRNLPLPARGLARLARAAALVVGAGLVGGCAYKVKLDSVPSPARVELPDEGGSVVTPAVVDLRWTPQNQQIVRVSAPGYRVLTVDLRQEEIRSLHYVSDLFRPATWRGEPRGVVTFVLVPLHGPVGTWDSEEVP